MLKKVRERLRFWATTDRLGPDIPLTHWQLHFPDTMRRLCKKKFRFFADTAEFRPGAYAIFPSEISIGDRVVIRPGTMLFADPGVGITIEDGVLMGSGVHIYTTDHRFDQPGVPVIDQGYVPSLPVVLKRGCWIGANAILLKGVTIGENSVVGAGSVVTRDVPPNVLVVGTPARVVRSLQTTVSASAQTRGNQ